MVVMETLCQVSPPCVVWYAGLRSEEIVIEKSAQGHFLLMVIEMQKYTCIPSFACMHYMVGK